MDRPPHPTPWRLHDLLIVISLALVSLLLARQPLFWWLLFPFELFGTFVHELSHGFAAIATGGSFRRFVVNPDSSGMAWSRGGVPWIVASAGYVGSAVFGALLTILSARRFSARMLLTVLGVALGILCLLFVRNVFGIVSGLLIATTLCIAGRRLPRRWASGLVVLLAVQMILDALDSLLDLVTLSASLNPAPSDAQIMADATGVPALVWAVLWNMVSMSILFIALRVAYRLPEDRGLSAMHSPQRISAEHLQPDQTQSP